MKIEPKIILSKVLNFVAKLRQYSVLIFFVVVMLAYSFLLMRVNLLLNAQPTPEALSEKLTAVKRPKVDQSVVDKLEELEDQNVEVKTLFEEARRNPFLEE
jgi:hypothetical protein